MFLSHGLTVAVALVCFFLQLSNVSAARIMIVGDSITHGSEGDYTWRYRLWQWLRNNNVNFEFVGPWQGTFQPNEPLPPQPPLFQGAPTPVQADHVTGGYALDIDAAFDKDHFSHSGRQADQVKNTINAMVSQYQPDYLLVELGFNDIGWFISDAAGLLRNMKTLIDNARAAKPDLRFAVANVPYRTRIGGREDLVLNTDIYNGLLANAIPGWSTAQSPIELVYFRENYSCELDSCPGGFDGLHPNQLGEYEIAQAFSRTLNSKYGMGSSALDVPANLAARPCPAPVNVRATTTPYGVALTWNKVYGAHGYRVRNMRSTFGGWSDVLYSIQTWRFDTTWVIPGETWSYQVRTDCGDAQKSAWSGVVSALANPSVPPGPTNIVVNPTADGLTARWDTPPGSWNIDRYEVITYDKDQPCDFLISRGIRGNSITIGGLRQNHNHVVAISTWSYDGPGFPSTAFSVIPGQGRPGVPQNVRVETRDPTTVKMGFTGDAASANYRAWTRNVNNASDFSKADNSVVDLPCLGIAYLFPGVWNFEFCMTALNGNLESAKSSCVMGSANAVPGLSECPARPAQNCGWGEPGAGGDGTGQPGSPGGGTPGGGGEDDGGDNGGSGDVYINPSIWNSASPHVTCQPPCNIILPPKTLATSTTIILPPYTTDLEVVWTSNGVLTRSIKTTTITLPPVVTKTISFWTQSFPPGPTFTFSPVPRIFPPPVTIRNDPVTSVTRTITPSPYPTVTQGTDDDNKYGGPFPPIIIDIGTPGPICIINCGSPCQGGTCGGNGPCIPLLTCPKGADWQDPADPDKDNDEDDDDDDDDDEPGITCPFRPLDMSGPEPTERGPTSSETPDLLAGPYPGPYDSGNTGGGGTTPPPVNTQRLWVFYEHYIDEINDDKEWFFVHRPLDNSQWWICDEGNDVQCPSSNARCLIAPEGNLNQPPWPNGQWEVTRGGADDCIYRSNGSGPGTLSCPNKATITCKGAADTSPAIIECPIISWSSSFYAAVYCDYI